MLAGKRSKIPRPNSFLFPVKREALSFNIPRPNGFMFPQAMGKRAGNLSGYVLCGPNTGLLFASRRFIYSHKCHGKVP